MHGKKRTPQEWQEFYDAFDLDINGDCELLDPQPATVDELLETFGPFGFHVMYVKWEDRQLYFDSVPRRHIYDMKVANPVDGYFTAISPEFESLEEAIDYPVLGGKSIRERLGECRIYGR